MKHLIANWKMNFINSDAWLKDFDLNKYPKRNSGSSLPQLPRYRRFL